MGGPGEDYKAGNLGAVFVLYMASANGSLWVKDLTILHGLTPGITEFVIGNSRMSPVAPIGDLNQDGRVDLVIGAPQLHVNLGEEGAVLILFMGGSIPSPSPSPTASATPSPTASVSVTPSVTPSPLGAGNVT